MLGGLFVVVVVWCGQIRGGAGGRWGSPVCIALTRTQYCYTRRSQLLVIISCSRLATLAAPPHRTTRSPRFRSSSSAGLLLLSSSPRPLLPHWRWRSRKGRVERKSTRTPSGYGGGGKKCTQEHCAGFPKARACSARHSPFGVYALSLSLMPIPPVRPCARASKTSGGCRKSRKGERESKIERENRWGKNNSEREGGSNGCGWRTQKGRGKNTKQATQNSHARFVSKHVQKKSACVCARSSPTSSTVRVPREPPWPASS